MSILWGVKFTVSQGFPLTKLMAVNTGLARLRCLRFCTAIIMHCNYVLYAWNNCLKASHNPTISCRHFRFWHFSLSPLWPWLLSPFRHVAIFLAVILLKESVIADDQKLDTCGNWVCSDHDVTSQNSYVWCLSSLLCADLPMDLVSVILCWCCMLSSHSVKCILCL